MRVLASVHFFFARCRWHDAGFFYSDGIMISSGADFFCRYVRVSVRAGEISGCRSVACPCCCVAVVLCCRVVTLPWDRIVVWLCCCLCVWLCVPVIVCLRGCVGVGVCVCVIG